MTREELKEHCKRQVQQFERIEKLMPVTLNDWKRYEEHKLILELLEQEPVIDKIRAEIKDWQTDIHDNEYDADKYDFVFERIFEIIDEYKAESEDKE